MLVLLSGAVMAAPAGPSQAHIQPDAQFGRFGALHLFKPRGDVSGVTILAAGDGGWEDPLMDRLTQQVLATGSVVIGIDTVAFLRAQDKGAQCLNMADDFEQLARVMEKQLGVRQYMAPVLMGYSSGASLVYAVLAQSSRGMFQGALSVGFCTDLSVPAPLCSQHGSLAGYSAADQAAHLRPVKNLPAKWAVLQGEQDPYCRIDTVRAFTAQAPARLYSVPAVDHFFERSRDWRQPFLDAYQHVRPPVSNAAPARVNDLPITEVTSTRPGAELAILFTGDGGWAELDQELAHDLSHAGISVVALSSLQYFWQARTPQQAARDLSRLMSHYTQIWRRPRVRLLGYSFGADVLPAIINALSVEDRARISGVGLLSLLPQTSFEIRVAGWFGKVVGEQWVRPELERLAATGINITCVYGLEDGESLCRTLPAKIARVVALPGGHNCNDDHASVVHAWLGAAPASRAMDKPANQTGNNVQRRL